MKQLLLLLLFVAPIFAQDANEILKRVDNTQTDFNSMEFKATMAIQSGSRNLSKEFFGFINDAEDKSFMEYTNPQDKGTKYLKLQKDMWIYIPDAQDILKISGHLLRDSMMGSDISYDDMLDQGTYSSKYNAESLISTNYNGKDHYLLSIIAKDANEVSYVKRDLYIEKKSFLISKVVMYAKGRKEPRAVKEFMMEDYINLGRLQMPKKMIAKDLRKKNSQTVISYTEIKIDVPLNDKMFTRAYLEQ